MPSVATRSLGAIIQPTYTPAWDVLLEDVLTVDHIVPTLLNNITYPLVEDRISLFLQVQGTNGLLVSFDGTSSLKLGAAPSASATGGELYEDETQGVVTLLAVGAPTTVYVRVMGDTAP